MSEKGKKPDASSESARLAGILFGDSQPGNSTISSEEAPAALAQMFRIERLESDLRLPSGFFGKLVYDDDWSFVIKLHALIEAAITHLLTMHFGQPALAEVFSFLEMSNQRTGKIAFARASGLIDSDIKRFVQKLSELRNQFAHNVTNTTLTLRQFFSSLDVSDLNGYRKGFTLGFQKEDEKNIKTGPDQINSKELLKFLSAINFDDVPRLSIWICALHCLSVLHMNKELAVIKQARQVLESELARRIMNEHTERKETEGT